MSYKAATLSLPVGTIVILKAQSLGNKKDHRLPWKLTVDQGGTVTIRNRYHLFTMGVD